MADAIRFNHIPETIQKLQQARNKLVRTAAFNIQRTAQQIAPVDTGLLKNSIYTVTSDSSGAAAADTKNVRKKGVGMRFLDETFPQIGPTGDPSRALVVVGALYGIFVEMGTIHMAGRSFLHPAALLEEGEYLAAWAKLEEMLAI